MHPTPLLDFIDFLIGLCIFIVFVYVILSWLILLDIVNRRNRAVYMFADSFQRLTEPMLRPIRRRLPDLGGVDISPLVLILALYFVRYVILSYLRIYLPV
jgi:YggT family protein